MDLSNLYESALQFEFLAAEEGVLLFNEAPLTDLMYIADQLRQKQVGQGTVTWQIDRNVNTTNVCIANCKFCNFYRIPGHPDAYITDINTYIKKIEETFRWGGRSVIIAGRSSSKFRIEFLYRFVSRAQVQISTIKIAYTGPSRNCTYL